MRNLVLLAAVFYSAGILAAEPVPEAAAKQPDTAKLLAALKGEKIDSITPAAIPGLYEVVLGGQVLYLSADGQFVMQGEIVDLGSLSNVTEKRRSALRGAAIDKVGEENMVIFGPQGPVKHTITVFTDIDCGYCRRMHSQMAEYNKEGIRIRYLWFPREGIGSESYKKAVAVWCAADRQEAMTKAKRGETIEMKSCEPNPVQAQYELGQKLGVRGTPSMVLESGEILPGYVSPIQLAELLAENKSKAARITGQP